MYLKQKTIILNLIFHNITAFTVFDQIGLNAALVSIRGIFQKHHKIWWPQMFEQ